ncbi:LPPG:FO 2-phospho-L-lactate transferase CofD/UPF0052 [Melia azedarach]|uniref:LPPG:FO 2-phospho-L-lactate transferase CofD/UPF0052 n=1 Tax=Melia azedarach TaxID=155640 RepID=A0ACC1WXL3_MELAZ|nr:LPPG:FO 2-phospho-L-lactate transferase CofD/UPF0052 [Melia azedarach]
MDNGGEGISWTGDIVQKFEDLLLEVDGVMRQLQRVGTNFMQFYLDLVENEWPQSSENTDEEQASDIDDMDSKASKISIDEDHCENASCNENHLLCSPSHEPIDGVHFDSFVKENVDARVYEKSEVIGEENLFKDNQSQPEMSDIVSPEKEESNTIEDAFGYISSTTPSYCSDYSYESVANTEVTTVVASTESPYESVAQGMLDNDVSKPETDTIQSFRKVKLDESCLLEEEDDLKNMDTILKIIASARPEDIDTILEILASAIRQDSHREKLHSSIMKTITQDLKLVVRDEEKIMQNLKQIVEEEEEEEKLRESLLNTTQEQETCDSEWVII